MKVLIVGGGGREHVLAWKIAQSPQVKHLYCAPGNPGISKLATCIDRSASDIDGLVNVALELGIGLVVVGPEDPLAHGAVDRFRAVGIAAFGPSAAAAQLEASKTFAKDLMRRYNIPTAAYAEFDAPDAAKDYVRKQGAPIVIKADGLAAGKGVTVAHTLDQACAAIDDAMVNKTFGAAGDCVIIEECLVGEEASILAFTDGRTVLPMASSQDHKAVYDNDQGPNTGGMGAYSPAPVVTVSLAAEIEETILRACVNAMAQEDRLYQGVLYAGLMITKLGPKVIEFNCRFGDPEAQVVLPRMKSDLVPLLLACCDGTLHEHAIQWHDNACVTVVMASGGYPGAYEKGKVITGIDAAERSGLLVFHAGTRFDNSNVVTAGGRVLNVTATGDDIPEAIEAAYHGITQIAFEGAHYRNDIGQKALVHLTKSKPSP